MLHIDIHSFSYKKEEFQKTIQETGAVLPLTAEEF